jgi:pimeloyl-ACP methyl ester carboxylesterase
MRDEARAAHEYTETWCKDGKIGHVALRGGARVRYLRVGVGPPLVLMHTVRTQLDHFQFVIPQLTESFTVYALDFPGMGWSDIVPGASYDEAALRAAVVRVVEDLDLAEVTLAGESMGATLSLTASVDLGARVRRIVAFNTYDFADGAQRANLLARLVIGSIRLPGWGPIVAHLETKPLLKGILRGGLHDPGRLPDHYLGELRRVGRRPPISSGREGDLPQPGEPDRRSRTIWTNHRAGHVGLWRRGLVAPLGSSGQHRVRPRRTWHRAAQQGTFHRIGGPRRRGADPARRREDQVNDDVVEKGRRPCQPQVQLRKRFL